MGEEAETCLGWEDRELWGVRWMSSNLRQGQEGQREGKVKALGMHAQGDKGE